MRSSFIILLTLLSIPLFGQEPSGSTTEDDGWTLRECIDHAYQSNLDIKQRELSVRTSELDHRQAKYDVLPSLNGFASHGYNWGQRIDPFTNQFATRRVRSNSFSLSSSITLFNGLRQYRNIQQREFDLMASRFDVEKMKDDIALNIATTYLQILFNKEILEVSKEQVERSKLQVKRMEDLQKAGQVSKGDLLDLKSQLANEKLNLTQAKNDLQLARLDLVQLLQLQGEKARDFRIEPPDLKDSLQPEVQGDPISIYNKALEEMPSIKGSRARISSAEKQLQISQGMRSPTLSVNGSYGTGYSGARKEAVGEPQLTGFDTVGVTSMDQEAVIVPNYDQETETVPFEEQFNDNLNQTVTVQLQIPIFNNMTTNTNIQKAKIQMEQAELEKESAKNQLHQNIRKAYADALAAKRKYEAAYRAVKAMEESFKYAEIRYEAGAITTVDYVKAKTDLTKARSDLLQAKYDHIFKTQVLRFYQGEELGFQ